MVLEGWVQDALAVHLKAEGWNVREVADTGSKAPGIDLVATATNRWLAVEVKGYPNMIYDHGRNGDAQANGADESREAVALTCAAWP